jgi:hypothetical protein
MVDFIALLLFGTLGAISFVGMIKLFNYLDDRDKNN